MAARQQQTGKPKHGPGSRAAAMMPGEKAGDLRGTLRKLLSYLAPYKFRLFFVLFIFFGIPPHKIAETFF